MVIVERRKILWEYNHNPLTVLNHQGIKGMKWGVRRKQDELDRISGRAYQLENLTDGDYKMLKGSTLHRVTKDPKIEKEGYAYVSFTNADVKGYREEISSWINNGSHVDIQTFDLTMKVKKDMLVAGELSKVRTFLDLYGNEKIDNISMAKIYQAHKKEGTETGLCGKPARLAIKLMDQKVPKDIAIFYSVFSMAIYRDDKLKTVFFDALKNKGYDAIEDFEDSYSHRMQPLIVFERENSLKVVNVKKIPLEFTDGWAEIVKGGHEATDETKEYHEKKFAG